MRLDKFLCKSTHLTRADATAVIENGDVSVNGQVEMSVSTQVHENNIIILDGQRLVPRPSRYLMFNKPANTLCSNVDGDYPSVFNYLTLPDICDMHIAGRLDADTTGLLLITDDGRWSFNLFNPQYHCAKVYKVTLRNSIVDDASTEINPAIKALFTQGMLLPGEKAPTKPAKLQLLSSNEVLLTITEGRYHQVKRMFAYVGNKVRRLHRQQVGEITLDIPEGQWRFLTEQEVASANIVCSN